MSLLFYTGFDYYNTSQVNRVWDFVVGNGATVIPGRLGGQGWGYTNVGTASYISKEVSNSTTVIVGIAFNFSAGDATNPFLLLQDGTSSFISPITQIDLRVTIDAAFQVTRNGTVLATTANSLFAFGFWNYIELETKINSSSGTIQLRFNGATLLNLTGLNTMASGNNYVNMVRLAAFNTGTYTANFDDLYVLNDVGSVNNAFLGEIRVDTQYPSANGITTDFMAVGAGTNYQCVDEPVMDDDTTYTTSSVVGDIDEYQMGTVSFSGSIYAVQVNVANRKDNVGSRTIAPVLNSGGTDYIGTSFSCQTDYLVAQQIYEQDPNGTVAWTNTSLNSINAGVKIVA